MKSNITPLNKIPQINLYSNHKDKKCGLNSRKCRYCHIEKEICKEDLVKWKNYKDYDNKYKTITTLLTIEARYRHKLETKHLEQLTRAFKSKGTRSLKSMISSRINKRIKIKPLNDGKQTPYMGHAIDMAMHTTAVCCRFCVEHWHNIKNSKDYILNEKEINYLDDVVYTYITEFLIPDGVFRDWMTSKITPSGQFYEHGKYVIQKKEGKWIVEKIENGDDILTPWYQWVNEIKSKYGSNIDIKEYLLKD